MIGSEFRLDFAGCRSLLLQRLREPAPGRIQLLAGPRQVGKTTLLLELKEILGDGAAYAAGDEPRAALPGFWEETWRRAEERAERGDAWLLFDEIQHVPDWSRRLKGEWDRIRRRGTRIRVVASGSSSLHLGRGARESLAGRFERITLVHWSARSLMEVFGQEREIAAQEVVSHGSYPGARGMLADPARWSAYVLDSIISPAIGRDLLALGVVRRPALLRQVFAVAADLPAQIVTLQKLQGLLQDRGALETISHYLHLLEDAFLVAALEKRSDRKHRRRSAPPKLVVLNNALITALHPQGPPDPASEPDRFGVWVENACLAFAWNAGQRVTYWREEPMEVDGVLEGSWGRWAIEVKTGRFDSTDLRGLYEFCRRNRSFRPLVVTGAAMEARAASLGVEATTWQKFLVNGPPGTSGAR